MEGTTTFALQDWLGQITGALGDVFSMENLGTILVAALGFALIFVLGWFGYRFITRKAKKAVTKGGM